MNEFLKFVVGQLIDRPEELLLHEEERDGVYRFAVHLPKTEVGKVIGKQGHTIRAIRNLIGTAAARQNKRAWLDIVER